MLASVSMREIADVFAWAAIFMAGFIVPLSLVCLFAYEEIAIQPRIRIGGWRIWLPRHEHARIPILFEWAGRRRVFKKGDAKVVYVRQHSEAKYWPSLYITTWLTRLNSTAIAYIVFQLVLRVSLRYDTIGVAAIPQPGWSYMLSMFGSILLLCALMSPPLFLLWAKQEVRKHTWPNIQATEPGSR